jgi:hypothetical protein
MLAQFSLIVRQMQTAGGLSFTRRAPNVLLLRQANLVVVATLRNFELLLRALAGNSINQPVFSGNPSRPPSAQFMLKGLWFPELLKWDLLDGFD